MTRQKSFRLLTVVAAVGLWAGAPGAMKADKLPAPTLDGLAAELKSVTGTAAKDHFNVEVRIRVVLRKVLLEEVKVRPEPKTGAFKAALTKITLAPTMTVRAQHVDSAGVEGEAVESEVPVTGASPIYDWGRIHADFTTGAMFSKKRGLATEEGDDFSQPDLYLDFILDVGAVQSKKLQGTKRFEGFYWRVNPFVNARLTTIPVLSAPPPPATSGSTSGRGTSGSGGTASQPTGGSNTTTDFLKSKKSAQIQAGVYVPFFHGRTSWQFKGANNSWFFGPIFKMAFQTITGGLTTGESARFGGDDLFNSFATGVRFGHYSFEPTASQDLSPELHSYLDITAGKWENFERCTTPAASAGSTPSLTCKKDIRLGAEGRLKIPATPFQVGFDLNTGEGRDDLRFLLGVKFDIGKLFGGLKTLAGP